MAVDLEHEFVCVLANTLETGILMLNIDISVSVAVSVEVLTIPSRKGWSSFFKMKGFSSN